VRSVAPARPDARSAGARAGLIAVGLTSAVVLRESIGGSDPASSTLAAVVFATALAAVAIAAGVRGRLPAPRAVAIGLIGGGVLVGGSLLGRPVLAVHMSGTAAQLLAWSPLVAAIAVAEEALLRGALFGAVEARWGTVAALGLTTAAFALMHLPLYGLAAMPLDIAVGLWLGGLRILTGGVAAPAAAHVVADLAAGWLW
jgi:membrane protease YdiL (CAAX protease family)